LCITDGYISSFFLRNFSLCMWQVEALPILAIRKMTCGAKNSFKSCCFCLFLFNAFNCLFCLLLRKIIFDIFLKLKAFISLQNVYQIVIFKIQQLPSLCEHYAIYFLYDYTSKKFHAIPRCVQNEHSQCCVQL